MVTESTLAHAAGYAYIYENPGCLPPRIYQCYLIFSVRFGIVIPLKSHNAYYIRVLFEVAQSKEATLQSAVAVKCRCDARRRGVLMRSSLTIVYVCDTEAQKAWFRLRFLLSRPRCVN